MGIARGALPLVLALSLSGCALYPRYDDGRGTRAAKITTRVVLGVATVGLSELIMYWSTHPEALQRDFEAYSREQQYRRQNQRRTECETRCVSERDPILGTIVTKCRDNCREY